MDIGFFFMIIWYFIYWINFKYFIWCFLKLNYVVEIEVKFVILKYNIKKCFFLKMYIINLGFFFICKKNFKLNMICNFNIVNKF